LMMSLWDALRMNMMISYQELVRTFPSETLSRMERCLQTPNSHQWFCKFLLTELIDGSGTCSYKKY
ncbi:hypothetical protein RZP13_17425, partial [Klebsiella quasipneumoniae subsp. similipneumoniae]|uniref:hypothetical protein n=1 Tax=Klebsiella quasipneumoniae TaxID=1463165 RepID=UPI00292A6B6F